MAYVIHQMQVVLPYPGVGMSSYVCRDTRCIQDGSCSALTGNRNVSLRMQGYTSHVGMGDISPCAGAVMQDAYVRTCTNRRTLPALIENRLGRIGADQLNPCQPAEPAIHPGSVDAVKPALSSQTGYAGSPRRNQFGLPRGSRRWRDAVSVHDWCVAAAASSQKTKNPPFAAGSVFVPPERVELSLSD